DALGAAHHLRGARERTGLERRCQQGDAVAGRSEAVVGGDGDAVEDHFEDLLAADLRERTPRYAGPVGGYEQQAQAHALAPDDREEIGNVSVLDEQLAAAEPAGHAAGERDVARIARSALFDQREGGDEVTARQGGEQTLPLLGAAA